MHSPIYMSKIQGTSICWILCSGRGVCRDLERIRLRRVAGKFAKIRFDWLSLFSFPDKSGKIEITGRGRWIAIIEVYFSKTLAWPGGRSVFLERESL